MLKVSKELNAAGEMSGWAFEGGCEGWSLALPGGDDEFKTTHGEIGLEVIQPGEAGTAKCSTKMKPVFRTAFIGHGGVTLGVNYIVSTMTFPPKASSLATPGL